MSELEKVYLDGYFRKFHQSIYCPKPFIDKWNVGLEPRNITGWANAENCELCEHCKDINLDGTGVWCGFPTKKLTSLIKRKQSQSPSALKPSIKDEVKKNE